MKKYSIIFILLAIGCNPEPQPNEMRFHSVNNLPVLSVEINGKSGRLLIDTGASVSIINSKANDRYGFSVGTSVDHIFGIGGGVDALTAHGVNVTYRDSIIKADFISLDISDVQRNTGAVGILGSDWMNRNNVKIDFETKTIKR